MNCFKLENVSFTYPGRENKALDGINLTVNDGDFILLCGPSGCGKSTLLRQLKTPLCPHGIREGSVLFKDSELDKTDLRTQTAKIGFVLQSCDNQAVTDKVWHELAFGLENLGIEAPEIRRRVAETASFFGIEKWFYKSIDELSGGQRQLLNLAAVTVMQPDVLILDEPTAQLDPIAAAQFLSTVGRINRELGTTVIISEHRLEELSPYVTKAAVMEKGKVICFDTLKNAGLFLKEKNSGMFLAMPCAMKIWAALDNSLDCPVTVCEGKAFLSDYSKQTDYNEIVKDCGCRSKEEVLNAKGVFFSYGDDCPDVLKGFDFSLLKGEIFALLGGNAAGKTTALKVLSGLKKPYRGKIIRNGIIALLPQDVRTLFLKKTVLEDLRYAADTMGTDSDDAAWRINSAVNLCGIEELLSCHPYDLSGGEQQRAALAKILITDPEILLLDEPTKGMDAYFKVRFADILKRLTASGVSVLLVSHDIDFCAEYSDRCGLIFDGNIVSVGTPSEFFCQNSFYTTSANRMSRHILKHAVTSDDVISAFGGKPYGGGQDLPENKKSERTEPKKSSDGSEALNKPVPLYRKLIAVFCGIIAASLLVYIVKFNDLSILITRSGLSPLFKNQIIIYAAFIASLFGAAISLGKKSKTVFNREVCRQGHKLQKRTAAAAVSILILIPLTIFAGVFYLSDRSYGVISLIVLFECMAPFFLIFEGRKPKARELVIIAALCALGVAGRAVFYMTPQFKPVMAITIVSGIAFGGETGFMVGAVSMLSSNVLFAQGPWTPWQMFCMGIIGFMSGVLFKKGLISCDRISLGIFGAVSAVVIYGGIMNPASVLMWSPASFNIKTVLASYVSGFPMDLIHAFATAFFLFVAGEPMLEKLNRIKQKYGLI